MRHRAAADGVRGFGRAITAVALVATLGGCAVTAGDGNVVDDWAAMASAAPVVPPSGVCYASSVGFASRINALNSDRHVCTDPHIVETFHVGQFPAEVTLPPEPGTPDYLWTFEECERKAKDFLGGDWYNGRLFLGVTVPASRQWEGGGRWYRCELIETKYLYSDETAKRESSLAGTLSAAAPVAQRCANIIGEKPDGYWDDLGVADCAQPHDAEYAGSFRIPGPIQPTTKQMDAVFDDCWDVIARYLGGTKSGIRVGYLAWGVAEDGWKRGDRYVRCYAADADRKIVGSVKGIGNAAPRRA
jgi:Septum formation